jgi:hypothetical protein
MISDWPRERNEPIKYIYVTLPDKDHGVDCGNAYIDSKNHCAFYFEKEKRNIDTPYTFEWNKETNTATCIHGNFGEYGVTPGMAFGLEFLAKTDIANISLELCGGSKTTYRGFVTYDTGTTWTRCYDNSIIHILQMIEEHVKYNVNKNNPDFKEEEKEELLVPTVEVYSENKAESVDEPPSTNMAAISDL